MTKKDKTFKFRINRSEELRLNAIANVENKPRSVVIIDLINEKFAKNRAYSEVYYDFLGKEK